jgi:septal ring factor EnvC (AmiA/AmiB activator)
MRRSELMYIRSEVSNALAIVERLLGDKPTEGMADLTGTTEYTDDRIRTVWKEFEAFREEITALDKRISALEEKRLMTEDDMSEALRNYDRNHRLHYHKEA